MSNEVGEKLPQNIQHLLMEIGEKSVLFKLFLLTKDTPWDVYQNLGESGCDLVLLNNQTGSKIKVEVKTRQRLYTTSLKNLGRVDFSMTENEYKNIDFLIAYWFEENYFFIVPKSELKEFTTRGTIVYKFIVRKNKNGTLDPTGKKFLNKWETILAAL